MAKVEKGRFFTWHMKESKKLLIDGIGGGGEVLDGLDQKSREEGSRQ
jgi:hypothetical protein